MKLTAELSLYPLKEEYIPAIDSFIAALGDKPELRVITNAMSTQVCGDHDLVFTTISHALAASYRQCGMQVLVVKFIPGELDLQP